MNVLRLLPVFLSALLLAAHFFRAGQIPGVAASLAFPFVLLIPRSWTARLVQLALVAGAAEWVRSMLAFVRMREAFGEPWARLAIILGAVALLTLLSALVFRARALRRRYRLE